MEITPQNQNQLDELKRIDPTLHDCILEAMVENGVRPDIGLQIKILKNSDQSVEFQIIVPAFKYQNFRINKGDTERFRAIFKREVKQYFGSIGFQDRANN